jgi:integrase
MPLKTKVSNLKFLHKATPHNGEKGSTLTREDHVPALPTGLVRDAKSGSYYHRRRLPTDLLPYFEGKGKDGRDKLEHNVSLRTKSYQEALHRFQRADAKLYLEWDSIRNRLKSGGIKAQQSVGFVINELTPAVIHRICLHHEAASLASDESLRNDGLYSECMVDEQEEGYRLANSVLKSAVRIGDVSVFSQVFMEFLRLTGYQVNLPDSECRKLLLAMARSAIKTNEKLLARFDGEDVPTPEINHTRYMIFDVVDDYLEWYPKQKKAAMFKKLMTVMSLFKLMVSNKPIADFCQTDVIFFMETLQKLPPRWNDFCRKMHVTPRQLATMNVGEISLKTYQDSYKAAFGPFLEWASSYWQDRGFPTTLSVSTVPYLGSRDESENSQRSFTKSELYRLFCGSEMRQMAENPELDYKFWLPHLGLFTGARITELCQLNPQVDIRRDAETGIWFLDINEQSESDSKVKKTVKTKSSRRRVPIHSTLIELGFLDYVNRVARTSRRLFPGFSPVQGNAGAKAGKWFIEFIAELGLRDETKGARLVGSHAFRSTLLNRAANLGVINAEAITGHASNMTGLRSVSDGMVGVDKSKVVQTYEGVLDLDVKSKILEKIIYYDLKFFKPVNF